MQKTLLVLAAFVAALLVGFLYNLQSSAPQAKETFMQQEVGAPLTGTGIGPYDNVYLPGVAAGWLATESVPKGAAPADSNPHPMHLLDNKTSPSCCPGTISNDMGCLCLTQQDKTLFASRGGNRALTEL
jgi:hypothetical protein